MDKTTEEFNRSGHALLDAEVRLNTIRIQISQLEREIATLNSVEANLDENIRILKRKRVVTIASEYRKVKIDLNTAVSRRAFLRIDLQNCLKVEKQASTNYDKAKEQYDVAFNRMNNPQSNVIQVDFGRKNR